MVGMTEKEGGLRFNDRAVGIEVQLHEKQHAKRTITENKGLTM